MSRRLGTLTSRTHSEQDPAEFDEDEGSLSAFTVDKQGDQHNCGSLPGGCGTSRCLNVQIYSQVSNGGDIRSSQVRDIEE